MKTYFTRLLKDLKETKEEISTQLEGDDLLLALEREGKILEKIEEEFEIFIEHTQ